MNSWYSVRLARWIWSLLWTRRAAWALVCLVSLITLYYQWENWRSARELAGVRQRMVERLGTDDPLALMPPKVADEENYFANPVLESWLRVTDPKMGQMQYTAPSHALLPPGFIQPEILDSADGEIERLVLDAWMKKRGGQGDETAATVLARELGDGNGLLPKLAEGLNKPFSIIKPGPREALEAAGDNPWGAVIPNFSGLSDFQRQLGLHLRSAALAGDTAKTASTALIMLRVSEGTARGGMIGCLVPLALHETSFDALHAALSHPAWTPESLGRLQVRLGQFDDLQQYQLAHGQEILGMFFQLAYWRSHRAEMGELFASRSTKPWVWERLVENFLNCGLAQGPIGWHDANVAFYADCMLEQLGPAGPEAWLTAAPRCEKVLMRSREANSWPNPRRFLGAIAIPNVGTIAEAAAENLFRRRCLIIACALEKHRLKHGGFPASLEAVKEDLKLYTITDPARPSMEMGYRLESGGYLLWSAGPDARDDGGQAEKDWLWRMRLAPERQ
ncbi:hypothetical protein [Prosthecobacter sp.]|uniref:hypothetical protein n=1 Tax=Prosthecobacter sp. TaxID=1965333 RepID=UPI003782F7BD